MSTATTTSSHTFPFALAAAATVAVVAAVTAVGAVVAHEDASRVAPTTVVPSIPPDPICVGQARCFPASPDHYVPRPEHI